MRPFRALVILAILLGAVPTARSSDPSGKTDPQMVRLPTVVEALGKLQGVIFTPEHFQKWCGVIPQRKPEGDYWRLADGVVFTNYLQFKDGTRQIACWGQVKK